MPLDYHVYQQKRVCYITNTEQNVSSQIKNFRLLTLVGLPFANFIGWKWLSKDWVGLP